MGCYLFLAKQDTYAPVGADLNRSSNLGLVGFECGSEAKSRGHYQPSAQGRALEITTAPEIALTINQKRKPLAVELSLSERD